MWTWLQENSQIMSALAAWATIGLWALYLQLIYSSYRLSRRAKILINRGASETVDAKCIIANMGAEPIYIEAIRVMLSRDDHAFVSSLGNLEIAMAQEGDRRPQWMQGPMASGEMIDIGTFRSLVDHCIDNARGAVAVGDDGFLDGATLKIIVVGTMASEHLPVAARREFRIGAHGAVLKLHPCTLRTDQIRSKRERREIENVLSRDLESEWREEEPQEQKNAA